MRDLLTQLGRFTVVGAFGTVAHYAVLILLVETAGAGPVLASSAGALVGALVNYFLNYYFTFRSTRRHIEAIVQFYIVAGTGFVLNALLMWLCADVLQLHYMLAQILATGVVLLWNFSFNRLWTFRAREIESSGREGIGS